MRQRSSWRFFVSSVAFTSSLILWLNDHCFPFLLFSKISKPGSSVHDHHSYHSKVSGQTNYLQTKNFDCISNLIVTQWCFNIELEKNVLYWVLICVACSIFGCTPVSNDSSDNCCPVLKSTHNKVQQSFQFVQNLKYFNGWKVFRFWMLFVPRLVRFIW